jgi:transcriptional regulator with XRE-family HTH domain
VTRIRDLHRRWLQDADYKDGYDALGEAFDLERALIEARTAAGLSQSQLARTMKTSQAYIARIEGGQVRPSTDALQRSAQATRLEPARRVAAAARAAAVGGLNRRRTSSAVQSSTSRLLRWRLVFEPAW